MIYDIYIYMCVCVDKIDQIWGPINIDHSAGKSMEELGPPLNR